MRPFALGMTFMYPDEELRQVGHRPPPLVYRCEPVEKAQARFHGRYLLRPELNLSRFVTRAEIDWVDLKLTLGRSSQGKHVSRFLAEQLKRRPHVTDSEGRERQTGCVFVARIQRPEPESLARALAALDASHGLVAPVEITGIEIAIDWWPYSPATRDPAELAVERLHLVSVLQRHFLPAAEVIAGDKDKPRFKCPDKGDDEGPTPKLLGPVQPRHGKERVFVETKLNLEPIIWRNWDLDVHNAPFLDSTMYFGGDKADIMYRIQNKTTDNRKGDEYDKLPAEQRRARVEVTLKGGALEDVGLRQLDDLAGFRFEELRKELFPFWLPTLQPGPGWWWFERKVFAKTGLYGLEARQWAHDQLRKARNKRLAKAEPTDPPRKPWKPGRVRKTGHRLAFDELNHRAYDALEQLSRCWKKLDVKLVKAASGAAGGVS